MNAVDLLVDHPSIATDLHEPIARVKQIGEPLLRRTAARLILDLGGRHQRLAQKVRHVSTIGSDTRRTDGWKPHSESAGEPKAATDVAIGVIGHVGE